MRRKLFCILLSIICIIFLLDFLGVALVNPSIYAISDSECNVVGKVAKVKPKTSNIQFVIDIISVDKKSINFHQNILISYYGDYNSLKNINTPYDLINETISFDVKLYEANCEANPHAFNYRKYLKSQNIALIGTIGSFQLLPTKLSIKDKYEKYLLNKKYEFSLKLREDTKGIILGVLFGDTSELDENIYDEFRNNGTAHILAVSGLHIGILYGIYKKIVGKRKNYLTISILLFILFTYGMLSMWSPSVVRATLMIVMSLIAFIFDLRYDMLTAMSAVALLLIIQNPYVVFGTGFQMSFLAITSIAFIVPIMSDYLPELFISTVSVNLGLLFYQMYEFNYISLVSIFINIPIVYLAGYFVPIAILQFAIFLMFGQFGLISPITDGLAFMITKLNKMSTLNGYSSFEVPSMPIWLLLIIAVTMFFLASEQFQIIKARKNKIALKKYIAVLVIFSIVAGFFTHSEITKDDIIFVNVGQGDCTHINDKKKDVLIDGGGTRDYNIGKNTLKPYLLKNGNWNVDLAMVTHEHMDHYKGIEELTKVYPVKNLMRRCVKGDVVTISKDVRIETLWPISIDDKKGQDENSQCSVFMIYDKGCKILITGDIDEEGEHKLIAEYKGTNKLKADILKVGHHGSKTSSSNEFLDVVSPQYAVIQVGKNNYGHPSSKVIENCQKKGIIVFRNDLNGAVGFSFKKGKIVAHTMR